jgi:hypothetical protein
MDAIVGDYLSTKETAHLFGLSASNLTKLRVYGGGPLFYKLGRRVLYRRQDIEAWISDHVRQSTSDSGPTSFCGTDPGAQRGL